MNHARLAFLAVVFVAFCGLTSTERPEKPVPANLHSDIASPMPIPAEFSDVGIVVPVTIKGRRLDFVLDSGAARVSIDQSVAAQLGAGYSRGYSRIPELSVAGWSMRDVSAMTLDFQRETYDRRIVGLLGLQFFAGHQVDINFKDKTVTLLPENTPAPDPKVWTPLDIDLRYDVPRTHAQFNAVDGLFVIDTGAVKTILGAHYFEKFHPKGTAVVQGQVVDRFDFGPLSFSQASVNVASGPEFDTNVYDGLIGRDILSNFELIFDYQREKVYVKSFVS